MSQVARICSYFEFNPGFLTHFVYGVLSSVGKCECEAAVSARERDETREPAKPDIGCFVNGTYSKSLSNLDKKERAMCRNGSSE